MKKQKKFPTFPRSIRFSAVELMDLEGKAYQAGIPFATYIRSLVLTHPNCAGLFQGPKIMEKNREKTNK